MGYADPSSIEAYAGEHRRALAAVAGEGCWKTLPGGRVCLEPACSDLGFCGDHLAEMQAPCPDDFLV